MPVWSRVEQLPQLRAIILRNAQSLRAVEIEAAAPLAVLIDLQQCERLQTLRLPRGVQTSGEMTRDMTVHVFRSIALVCPNFATLHIGDLATANCFSRTLPSCELLPRVSVFSS